MRATSVLHSLLICSAFLAGTISLSPKNAYAAVEEIEVVDAVVASVNGKPITLQDLAERLPQKHQITLTEVSGSPKMKELLEGLIYERLLEEDALAHQVQVRDSDVEGYINEVAKRNNLSRPDFERALSTEGKTLAEYRARIRIEILRSRLTSKMLQNSSAISDEEITAYLEEHPVVPVQGESFRLSRIVIDPSKRSEEEVHIRIKEVLEKITAGTPFPEVAALYSETPEAKEGGEIGVVALNDLSDDIRAALEKRAVGEISPPLATDAGITIFRVEDKLSEESGAQNRDAIAQEVKNRLREEKNSLRLRKYFTEELPHLYPVERKL